MFGLFKEQQGASTDRGPYMRKSLVGSEVLEVVKRQDDIGP